MARRKAAGTSVSALQTDLVREILSWLDRTGLPVGSFIRELPLAKTLGVSRTPVRSALQVLETLGYVEFGPRRGFRLLRPVEAHGAVDDEALPRSPHERLQEAIIADRASGELPADVSEAELIQRYGASRGVVRRVMMGLGDDGIAQRMRGHGWRFAEMLESAHALEESYRFRIAVECAALGEPNFAAEPAELAPALPRPDAGRGLPRRSQIWGPPAERRQADSRPLVDRKSTRLNSSHI